MAHGLALIGAAASLAIFSLVSVQAQQTSSQSQPGSPATGDKPAVVFAEIVTAQATVTDVNKAERTVTLRTDDGREFAVKAGPEVKNFDQIEAGDKVTADYHQATAIVVRRPDPTAGASSGAAQAPTRSVATEVARPGEKPAGAMAEVVEMAATVEDIDYDKREVTLKGPGGNMQTVAIGDQVQDPRSIEKGDQVVVRHTEAVAVSVSK